MNKLNYKQVWMIIIAVVCILAVFIGTPIALAQRKADIKAAAVEEKKEIGLEELIEQETTEAVLETVPPTTEAPTEPEPTETTYPTKEGYEPVDEYVWARQDVNVRSGPGTDWDKLGILGKHKKVKRIGIGEDKWSMIIYEDQVAFVSTNYFLTEDPNPQ